MSAQLERAAEERELPQAVFVRQLIAAAVADQPVANPDPPTEEELLALLAEKARQGNVAAIRSLLLREENRDPRARAIALFSEMAAERQP